MNENTVVLLRWIAGFMMMAFDEMDDTKPIGRFEIPEGETKSKTMNCPGDYPQVRSVR